MQKTEEANKTFKSGLLKNFWKIAESEGGLMDRDTGIRCSRNICKRNEARGFPFAQWDPESKIMKYMHFSSGISEEFTQARTLMLSGELDVDSSIVQQAMQEAKSEGLTAPPPGELGNFPLTESEQQSQPHPAGSSASQAVPADLLPGVDKATPVVGNVQVVPEQLHLLMAATTDPSQKLLLQALVANMEKSHRKIGSSKHRSKRRKMKTKREKLSSKLNWTRSESPNKSKRSSSSCFRNV